MKIDRQLTRSVLKTGGVSANGRGYVIMGVLCDREIQ